MGVVLFWGELGFRYGQYVWVFLFVNFLNQQLCRSDSLGIECARGEVWCLVSGGGGICFCCIGWDFGMFFLLCERWAIGVRDFRVGARGMGCNANWVGVGVFLSKEVCDFCIFRGQGGSAFFVCVVGLSGGEFGTLVGLSRVSG